MHTYMQQQKHPHTGYKNLNLYEIERKLFPEQCFNTSLAYTSAALAERRKAGAALRIQQRQRLELREEEKDWGARIQALVGKPHVVGAARFQALSGSSSQARGNNFAAMQAAGAARLQALIETGGKKSSTLGWSARIGKVENKYHELVAEAKQDTKLKERRVQEIFAAEMKNLVAAGHKKDHRLRSDEENAETTILAKKKENEIRQQLQAVKMEALERTAHLNNQLKAAHILALKYKQEVVTDKLPTGVRIADMPEGLAKEVGMDRSSTSNSTAAAVLGASFEKQLEQITEDAAADAGKAKTVQAQARKDKIEEEKKAAAREKDTAKKAKKEAASKEKARKVEARKEQQKKERAATKMAKEKLKVEQAAAVKSKVAKLEAARKEKKERQVRCTSDHCPLDEMDQVAVVNGNSIHKMEHLAQDGHGLARSQARAMFQRLTSKIQSDFKQVTGFAQHQEHILDVKKAEKDTASFLGQQVALSVAKDPAHGLSLFLSLSFLSRQITALADYTRLALCFLLSGLQFLRRRCTCQQPLAAVFLLFLTFSFLLFSSLPFRQQTIPIHQRRSCDVFSLIFGIPTHVLHTHYIHTHTHTHAYIHTHRTWHVLM